MVYELKITKNTGGISDRYYLADEGVFAIGSRGLEKLTDPLNYSWNIGNRGSVYLFTLTGKALEEAQRKIAEVK